MTGPTPRSAITDLPAYVPGMPASSRDGLPAYKLSSNENPNPPPPAVLEAVAEAAQTMNRYPDMGNTALRAGLAAHLGVRPEQIAPATGSVAVLFHLLSAYCGPGDEVVHAWRSFEAYPISVAVTGAKAVPVPLIAAGSHDLAAMAAAITERTKVVVLCSPNNPTGPALSHAEVAAFIDHVPGEVLVVLDEAYREFVRMADPLRSLELIAEHENVVAMRTFAKAYGLAGLRVGYLVGPDPVAAAVRACSLPFGVSGVATAATLASLQAEPELLARVDLLVAERDRVVAGLRDQGWRIPDAQGNFVWFPLGDRTAAFTAAAADAGLSVRPFAEEGVRVTIGESAANDVVLTVAAPFGPQA